MCCEAPLRLCVRFGGFFIVNLIEVFYIGTNFYMVAGKSWAIKPHPNDKLTSCFIDGRMKSKCGAQSRN